MSKNTVEPGRPQMTIWRMRVACWVPTATKTHSEYVTLIALPRQQWLHERATMIHCMYIPCLVNVVHLTYNVCFYLRACFREAAVRLYPKVHDFVNIKAWSVNRLAKQYFFQIPKCDIWLLRTRADFSAQHLAWAWSWPFTAMKYQTKDFFMVWCSY
jgi:hypothetical protein